jgi:23S rRNA pseudouridine2605 synthase
VASRRRSEELIKAGKVKVNGQTVTELGIKVDPERDVIEVNGKKVGLERKRTFLFYKPVKVITSMSDPQGRKTVADFFHDVPERVYPVGRLDYDTEGLLIVTNDGELANHLLHPRYEVDKVYIATVKGKPSPESLERLQKGVELEDGLTAPAKVRLLAADEKRAKIELTIHEGRNRQVRRMCEAVGHPVLHLIRKRIGFLTLSGMKKGSYRELSPKELARLKKMLNM